ncbi:5104_t:CDS:1, partial [Gigaspora rosea]
TQNVYKPHHGGAYSKIPTGRTPKWFEEITNNMPNITSPSCRLIEPNPFIHKKWKEGDPKW